MIDVAIFEDNDHLRSTLRLMLQMTQDIQCIGAWPNADEAVRNLRGKSCAVVLMDVEMPGVNGVDATKAIKEAFPEINVLIHSMFNDDEYIFRAICNGASGYIVKKENPENYLSAIREVYSGGSPMSPGIARRVLEIFREGFIPRDSSALYNLTEQEKNVLRFLVGGKSYKMIASALNVSTETIKTHLRNIYLKLQVHSGTEAIVKAIRDKIVELPA